jgi:hypothetical protein
MGLRGAGAINEGGNLFNSIGHALPRLPARRADADAFFSDGRQKDLAAASVGRRALE